MVKYGQALRAMSVLWWKPFEFDSLNLMVDAVSLSWPVQTWYRRMIEQAPREEVEHLRQLTKKPIDIEALKKMPKNTFGYQYAIFFEKHYSGFSRSTTFCTQSLDLERMFPAKWVCKYST
jgi:ubiquinone biosynthesis protein Coq4